MTPPYDFIVVGSGPAGSLLATRLAESKAAPSVLLLEAGRAPASREEDLATRLLGSRAGVFATRPDLNWGYKSVPQQHLLGRVTEQSRGKALGGSSAINFLVYTTPPRGDMEEWAARVGDEFFDWPMARRLLDGIERYAVADGGPAGAAALAFSAPHGKRLGDYVHLSEQQGHGLHGKVSIEFGPTIKDTQRLPLDAWVAAGKKLNTDLNSGDPIGVGIQPALVEKGGRYRVTAASAYLADPPPNLEIKDEAFVTRVVFEGKRAVGIEVNNGEVIRASKEVILCAGTFNTPKLLMLSGVGPAAHLAEHGIPLVAELPGVGSGLRDHTFLSVDWAVTAELAGAPQEASAAEDVNMPVAWTKAPEVLASAEYAALGPEAERRFVARPTVPNYELIAVTNWPQQGEAAEPMLCVRVVAQGIQSRGTLRLASADPGAAPLIDPGYLSHPYDQRVVIEGIRDAMRTFEQDAIKKYLIKPVRTPAAGLASSDEEVLAFAASTASTCWHSVGTARMGTGEEDPEACVDSRFRVLGGVQGLRVADLSVCPLMPSVHTTPVAYLVGALAAERLVGEYALDA